MPRLVEARMAPAIIERLTGLGLEPGEIDAAVIRSRTLQHRRARREKRGLRVPSAIVPYTFNLMRNPLHPQAAEFRVVEGLTWPFDARIKL